ncbi:uncharacterized protein LOC112087996 [Eutrema salsugineum]|uniref:uncharacterized protein LOC112087996 n=1 Tax=Eutrema salsugineum TaxID=72664 RepID=UPI000CED1E9E|nr:uncharacterized protein LOC112087996 [Eutrema salsugineum]
MHTRGTRSNKDILLVNLNNKELAELKRTNRKAKKPAEMENANELIRYDAGIWRDQEGHRNVLEDQNVREPALVAARERTLGDYNRPEQFYANRSAIRAPAFQRNDFELKPVYYTLVGQHPFHAANWLKQLEPGSLTTWEETRNAFLHNFYDDARGVDWRYRMALDAASNGNFNTRYPDKAVVLIENLASSNSTKNADYERKKRAENMDGSQIAEVKAKLDSVHILLVEDEVEEEDVNFVHGSGFQGQRFGNQQSFLPGKTGTNPRHHCSAITLRSGEHLTPEPKKTSPAAEVVYLEDLEVAEPVSSDTATSIARHQLQSEADIDPSLKSAEEKVYKPKIPYPRSPRKSKQELDDARCKVLIEKLVIEIPLVDAVKITPVIRHYVKRMVTKNLSNEQGVMMISEQVSALIQNRIPGKLSDLGSFVLIPPSSRRDSRDRLAVNLGMTDFKPTRISLILADGSTRIPEGVLEDVLIKVGDCMIPTDFIVLEYGEETKDPFIIGRPFLATEGAIIDVRKGRIALNVGDLVMNFDMNKLMKKPNIND